MPRSRSHPRGGALVPAIIIIVALAISAAVFFLVTKKKIGTPGSANQDVVAEETTPTPGTPAKAESKPAAPAKMEPTIASSKSANATDAPKPPPAPATFHRPADVGVQLAQTLANGDMAAAAKIIAGGDAAQAAAAKEMLEKVAAMGFKVAGADKVQMVGQVENTVRLSIPLVSTTGADGAAMQLDVQKDGKTGWKISAVRLPEKLEAAAVPTKAPAMAAAPVVNPAGGAPLPTPTTKPLIVVDKGGPDAINFASDFVRSLLRLDYAAVRRLVDEEKVPSVKLAGLCIVFEDGKYELEESKPLLATVATEQSSWVIAKVKSQLRNEQTEFGIEMQKFNDTWRVVGMNLSKLLGDNAKSSATVGVPFTPLVQNPKGGESIALYYEYDSAVLHARAVAQLKIVADVLKTSPAKKLNITGHTDAMGTDTYNIALSQRRAESVKQFFLSQGVPVSQVETLGFGKTIPLSPNLNPDGSDNPEGRSRNRRSEILLDF
ncbi:MAG: OmpA family protein [Roseimicrobium sp.]